MNKRVALIFSVIGILVLALALRLWGIGFGFPYAYHFDEPAYVRIALDLSARVIGRQPNPTGFPNILFAEYVVYVTAASLVSLAVLFSILAIRRDSRRYLCLAAATADYAIATKWSVWPVIIPLFAAAVHKLQVTDCQVSRSFVGRWPLIIGHLSLAGGSFMGGFLAGGFQLVLKPVLYFLPMSATCHYFARYALPLVPFCALFGAEAVAAVSAWAGIRKTKWGWGLATLLTLAAIAHFISSNPLLDSDLDDTRRAFYAALDEELELVREFDPGKDDTEPPFIFDEVYGPAISLWQRERPGPVIKIHHLQQRHFHAASACHGNAGPLSAGERDVHLAWPDTPAGHRTGWEARAREPG